MSQSADQQAPKTAGISVSRSVISIAVTAAFSIVAILTIMWLR